MSSFLLPYAATGVSLLTMGDRSGATLRGAAVDVCSDALVWGQRAERAPSLGRHVHREFLRSAWLDFTPIIPATACHQRNDVETYSRSIHPQDKILPRPVPTRLLPVQYPSAAWRLPGKHFRWLPVCQAAGVAPFL